MTSVLRGVALIGLLLCGCWSTIDGPKARALVKAGDALLVDVRSPEEFDAGHLDGAINIPVDALEGRLDELKARQPKGVVVYCRSGARSARAQKILAGAGFRNVENLGAMSRW